MFKRKLLGALLFLVLLFIFYGCSNNSKIQVDKIYKNAKVFTANKENMYADSFVVKNGKFVYVGSEDGLSNYEGEVVDLNGEFVMPAVMDGHIHGPFSIANTYVPETVFIEGNDKKECVEFIKNYVKENDKDVYRFMLSAHVLGKEKLTRDDLDPICSDKGMVIFEAEGHSLWANSYMLKQNDIDDYAEDKVPNLSTYDRDENGRITGNLIEMTAAKVMMSHADTITDEQIKASLYYYFDYCKENGISTVLDAGSPGADKFHERVYKIMCDMDKKGEMPINFEGCYIAYLPELLDSAMENLKRYRNTYNTEHFKVNTLKVISDGTLGIHTAAMIEPYADAPDKLGGCLYDNFDLANLLKEMNKEGFNLHAHVVGERATKQVLDAVEKVKNEIGDDFTMNVTCAHLEIVRDEDLERFAKLGVMVDFTPWWNCGGCGGGGYEGQAKLLGLERGKKKFRMKTIADYGAIYGFSSDNIGSNDMRTWSPWLGVELGMTRTATDKTNIAEEERKGIQFPSADECMSIEEMLLGYTINNAIILDLDDRKGSIEIGKDADYLIFEKDLTKEEKSGISNNLPKETYFGGKKQNLGQVDAPSDSNYADYNPFG